MAIRRLKVDASLELRCLLLSGHVIELIGEYTNDMKHLRPTLIYLYEK